MVETKNNTIKIDIEDMALSGVHVGALRARGNPKMKSYIWSSKNAFQIIDLEKSKENLTAALEFLSEIKRKGGVILFVGTGVAAKEITKKTAEELGMPYVVERWLGGTLTNFQTISKRVNYLKDLQSQKASGGFEKYTKYEALKLQQKMNKLLKDFGGIMNLGRMPDAVWVCSGNYDKIAVAEAIKKGIPTIGVVNTNTDPTLLTYPVPANDTALNSVNFILNLVKDVLSRVKVAVKEVAPEETAAAKKNGKN